ncbi:hypothetical protein LTR05_006913 [Lithohypha guttulata]|uniref:BTB domain-containing protein n=1 Tax=Lithohypha guttulata TaxID=1690604 RepID=A0AAN7SWQ2_9EURO|nr:hypothetical protein LTR05_006913 [Lithohypha guttulata]
MASSSDFPQYQDGDITIVVSTSKVYRLHSHTLRRVSDFFRNAFENGEAPRLTAAARRDGHTPYRFVLVQQHSDSDDRGAFISLQISESGRVQNPITARAPRVDLSGQDEDKCWDWLFGCFYGITPAFDTSTFGATVLDCSNLLEVADTIAAVTHIREVVDLALLRQDKVLWPSIATNPVVWAELGRRVKSPAIFREAVVHIVGKWKMLSEATKGQLRAATKELCQRKWDELELAKRAIEIRIAGHYPEFLCRNHVDKPHRTGYANDIYMWMALSCFRQYVSQSGNDGMNRQAEDGGYAWYKQFSQGGDAYLDHDAMRAFHTYFPMSSKACSVLESHMNVLKEDMKVFVKDLMVVRTHIDPATMEEVIKPWLTCTKVDKEDLPWYVLEEGAHDQ